MVSFCDHGRGVVADGDRVARMVLEGFGTCCDPGPVAVRERVTVRRISVGRLRGFMGGTVFAAGFQPGPDDAIYGGAISLSATDRVDGSAGSVAAENRAATCC